MQVYNVYLNPKKKDLLNAVFVKQGFNFYAGAFGVLWAIYKKMWLVAVMLALFEILIFKVLSTSSLDNQLFTFLIGMFSFLLKASYADSWEEWNLLINKYELYDVIASDDLCKAKYKFYESHISSQEAPIL